MKKLAYIIPFLLLVGIFSGIIYLLFINATSDSSVEPEEEVPVGNSFPDPSGIAGEVMTTTLRNDVELPVRDVRVGKERLGDSTFVIRDGNTPEPSYSIIYYGAYDFWQISIDSEPLAEVRQTAEEELRKQLGIPESEKEIMCWLDYSVLTTVYVNSFLAGQELGFSFCPGTVEL